MGSILRIVKHTEVARRYLTVKFCELKYATVAEAVKVNKMK